MNRRQIIDHHLKTTRKCICRERFYYGDGFGHTERSAWGLTSPTPEPCPIRPLTWVYVAEVEQPAEEEV